MSKETAKTPSKAVRNNDKKYCFFVSKMIKSKNPTFYTSRELVLADPVAIFSCCDKYDK